MRRRGIGPSLSIGYIVCDPYFKTPTQSQDLIFGSNDPQEIEVFLLNYYKRSSHLVSPSHLKPNRNVILVINRSIPIHPVELQLWNTRLETSQIKFYDQEATLRKILDEHKVFNTFVIITQTEDEIFGEAISRYPLVRRIIYNPQLKPRPFYELPTVTYVANSDAELSAFLSNLRYLLRNPPYLIRTQYPLPKTNVFTPPNSLNSNFLKKLIMHNESIRIFFYNSVDELIDQYNAVNYGCNNVVIGDTALENILRSHNVIGPNGRFINCTIFNSQVPQGTIMSTDEVQEIMLYLRNIPVSRYNGLSSSRELTGIYYNPSNPRLHWATAEIDRLLALNNPGINVYKYTDIRQIERNLFESP